MLLVFFVRAWRSLAIGGNMARFPDAAPWWVSLGLASWVSASWLRGMNEVAAIEQ